MIYRTLIPDDLEWQLKVISVVESLLVANNLEKSAAKYTVQKVISLF